MTYDLEYFTGSLGALSFGGGLAVTLNKPQNLWTVQEWDAISAHQIANWHAQQALMPPASLIDRQMHADLVFKAKHFSQNWLNSMTDIELGL